MGRTSVGIINFPPSALWKKILMFPILRFHCQVYLDIRPFHSMRIHDLGICVSYRESPVLVNKFTEVSMVAALL
jgi:hypothetical protein